MAWRDGFFNSVNGDRAYTAQQMSEMFIGLISNGVYSAVGDKLAVQPNNGMTIQINTGRGYFNGNWVNNDSEYLQELEGSDVILKRYCAVCIRVDKTDEVRSAKPYFKYSEFSTDPVKPEMLRSELVNEYCLAYVLINPGVSDITAADIEDTRGDNNLCGWVSGLIEQLDTTTLWEQYKAEWAQFMANAESESDNWQEEQQQDFDDWYNSLKTSLEGDIAATLTSRVQALEDSVGGLGGVSDTLDEHSELIELNKNAIGVTQSYLSSMSDRIGEIQVALPRSTWGTLKATGWALKTDGTYTQTIVAANVTASDFNFVFVSPFSDAYVAYTEAGCRASAQGDGTLTFICDEMPAGDIRVNILAGNSF